MGSDDVLLAEANADRFYSFTLYNLSSIIISKNKIQALFTLTKTVHKYMVLFDTCCS